MEWDAVVFDMDGLLVDTEPTWVVAETDLIEARGDVFDSAVRERIIGLRLSDSVPVFREHYGWNEPVEDLTAELLRRILGLAARETRPQPGAHDLLAYLYGEGVPLAIASSSPLLLIETVLEAMEWEAYFPVRCTAENEEHGKPAPDVYLRAAEKLGVSPDRCLALEDSTTGARAAVAAGMTCYAVPDPSHTADPAAFDGITPHVFGSLHAVLATLGS
jgi:HAD superfamily hydrolase (TIGR01509 family)